MIPLNGTGGGFEARQPIGRLRLACLALLVSLASSCGDGDKGAESSSKDAPVRPDQALRAIASRADMPPGLPSSLIGRAEELPQRRIFKRLRSSDREELENLAATFRTATDPLDRVAAIESMSEHYSEDLMGILGEALEDESPEVRAAVMFVLAGSTSPSVIPLAKRALLDPDESVRIAVPEVLRNVADLAVVPVFTQGIGDASKDVRYAFLDAAAEMGPEVSDPVLEAGLRMDDEKMRGLSLTLLKMEISHSSFEILIDALDIPDPDFHDSLSMEIELLVGENFNDAAEARAWWAANESLYDQELFPK
jgi:HEAT repeat protein